LSERNLPSTYGTDRELQPALPPRGYRPRVLTPEQGVDEVAERFGRHPGYRALHAKGRFYTGIFTATPEAGRLSRAAHLRGNPVDATVRFSNASGDPGDPDYNPDIRGMATSFHLSDGSRTDIVAQTSPRFPARTPDAFIELTKAASRDFAGMLRLPLFLAKHPNAIGPSLAGLPSLKLPASYATRSYYAIHAYKWVDADGGERYVRYTWRPEGGERTISARNAKAGGADYLQEEMVERLARGPARFNLELQIAADDDPTDDPMAVWPGDRETVTAGTLEITTVAPDPEVGGEVFVFDPVRVTDGIELSDDPILHFRTKAYSVSIERRMESAPES
jgi:catalase